ncbi:Transposase, Mutator family [Corynebacterium mustelae]|uniref:Transposase, Mutator family n=1 Tax=Corynebacterium mustelae TaxID=571915 RepID=A0A0G3H3Y6_9CORY|nr:Transposase, Mutator family [Corynebacterium mustelae]
MTYKDRKQVSAALKDVYTATDEAEAKKALDDFAASDLGHKYPQSVKVWDNAWDMIYSIPAVPTSSAEG